MSYIRIAILIGEYIMSYIRIAILKLQIALLYVRCFFVALGNSAEFRRNFLRHLWLLCGGFAKLFLIVLAVGGLFFLASPTNSLTQIRDGLVGLGYANPTAILLTLAIVLLICKVVKDVQFALGKYHYLVLILSVSYLLWTSYLKFLF